MMLYISVHPASVLNTELEDGTLPKSKFWGTDSMSGLVVNNSFSDEHCRKSKDGSDKVLLRVAANEERESESDALKAVEDLLSDPKYTIVKYSSIPTKLVDGIYSERTNKADKSATDDIEKETLSLVWLTQEEMDDMDLQ